MKLNVYGIPSGTEFAARLIRPGTVFDQLYDLLSCTTFIYSICLMEYGGSFSRLVRILAFDLIASGTGNVYRTKNCKCKNVVLSNCACPLVNLIHVDAIVTVSGIKTYKKDFLSLF